LWRRTALLWQPRGTTLRGASDSWRLTGPAAQALRYPAGPTMKHDAANTDAAATFPLVVRMMLVARSTLTTCEAYRTWPAALNRTFG